MTLFSFEIKQIDHVQVSRRIRSLPWILRQTIYYLHFNLHTRGTTISLEPLGEDERERLLED
jgi:hypothetical protein